MGCDALPKWKQPRLAYGKAANRLIQQTGQSLRRSSAVALHGRIVQAPVAFWVCHYLIQTLLDDFPMLCTPRYKCHCVFTLLLSLQAELSIQNKASQLVSQLFGVHVSALGE